MSSTPDWFIPDYPALKSNDLVGRTAVEGQLTPYPKIVRTMTDPPVNNQSIGTISFMLFSEPKKTKAGKPIYGFCKLRGNWNGEQQATFESSKIIREIDSKYPIKLAPVGVWVPITEDEDAAKEKIDVRMKEEEMHLRDEAIKEKEAEHRKIQRELKERADELRKGDVYDDPTSLTYYSMRMVTELRLVEERERQIRQLSSVEDNIRKVQEELARLEAKHPSYKDQWVDRYNEERRKSGIPAFCPSEAFLDAHNDAVKRIVSEMGIELTQEGEKEE